MAKPTPKVWPHTANEMLDLAVGKCMELGRVPSRRAWQKDNFFDFEELVTLLGKGDWQRAELKIALAYDMRTRATKKDAEVPKTEELGSDELQQSEPEKSTELESEVTNEVTEPEFEATDIPEVVGGSEFVRSACDSDQDTDVPETAEDAASVQSDDAEDQDTNVPETTEDLDKPVRRHRRREYTDAELRAGMAKIQEYYGITGIPGQVQINAAGRILDTPGYRAFANRWGPKADWGKFMEVEVTGVLQAETGVLENEPKKLEDEPERPEELVVEPEVSAAEVVPITKEEEALECELTLCAAQLDVIWKGQKIRLKIRCGEE